MESKSLCLFFVILVIYTSNNILLHTYARTSLSIEEDMELERQLKILNKVPVKTITTREGDIIDCIDIHKQPAFDHPLLTNHRIQMKPSSVPNGRRVAQTINRMQITKYDCPEGTVPIERITKEDLIRNNNNYNNNNKSLSDFPFIDQNHDIENSGGVHMLGLVLNKRIGRLLGAAGSIGVFNLTNVTPGQYSSNNIWVQSGSGGSLSFLAAGWRVSQQMNGDGLSRLFIYWTNAYKSGCYNMFCPGFVLVNKDIGVNVPIDKLNIKEGGGPTGISLPILIFQDRKTKNWWLELDGKIDIGYWPNKIFTTLQNGADVVAWGGVTKAGPDGISPPMGSGLSPNDPPYGGFYPDRGHLMSMGYVSSIYEIMKPYPHEARVMNDTSGCYGILDEDVGVFDFVYGGKGGQCG